jgi:hypothetical protein
VNTTIFAYRVLDRVSVSLSVLPDHTGHADELAWSSSDWFQAPAWLEDTPESWIRFLGLRLLAMAPAGAAHSGQLPTSPF